MDHAFSLSRGILVILDLAFSLFQGIPLESWILKLCFSMGSRRSWIPNFWHCMRSWISTFGWCTSYSVDGRCTSPSYVLFLCIILYLLHMFFTTLFSATSNIKEPIHNNNKHKQKTFSWTNVDTAKLPSKHEVWLLNKPWGMQKLYVWGGNKTNIKS